MIKVNLVAIEILNFEQKFLLGSLDFDFDALRNFLAKIVTANQRTVLLYLIYDWSNFKKP
jgi:hypothetical protein